MTLLFFDGLQDPLLVPKPEWTAGVWGSAQTGRDGSSNGSAAGAGSLRTLQLPSAAATCISGFALRASLGASNFDTFSFCTAGAVQQLTITPNASGFIEARKGTRTGTLLGTSSGHVPIVANTWQSYQAKAVLHLTAGSIEVRLNDAVVLTVTGVSTSTVTGSVTHLMVGGSNANFSFWDDFYVCDAVDATATQGRPNNDYLGDLKVASLFPTGAGDTTQWTPSTGTNFGAVDEVPPNTTDFVSDATSGDRDLYNVTDPTGVIGTVYGVRSSYYATKSDAGSSLLKPVLKENGTVTAESGQVMIFGTWTAICGAQRFVRPSDSAVWTSSDINNLQVGQDVG